MVIHRLVSVCEFSKNEVRYGLRNYQRDDNPNVVAHHDEHLAVVDGLQKCINSKVQFALAFHQNVTS